MGKTVYAILIILLGLNLVYGREENPFSMNPEKPKVGDNISVTYNAGLKSSLLNEAKEIIMYAKLVQTSGASSLVEVKMEKQGQSWTGSFSLKDSLAKVILFRFDSGDITEDNNGNCWSSFVYNSKGEPVENAHNTMSMLYQHKGLYGFPVPEDKEKSAKEIELEMQLYSNRQNENNPLAKLYKTYTDNMENSAVVEKVVNGIIKYYRENIKKEDAVINAISLLRKIKQVAKAEEITAEYVKLNPEGKFARDEKINDIYRETDKTKRVDLIKKYFNENKNIPVETKEQLEYMIMQALIALGKYDEAYDVLSKMERQNGLFYNSLAWNVLEKGIMLEKGVAWAKMGVDLMKNPDISTRPANVTLKDWKERNLVTLADILDTYAYGLDKLNRNEEAEKAFEEVFTIIKVPLGADYYARYIECLNKNNKFEKAVDFAEKTIIQGITNDNLISAYKAAFLKTNKTADEFEKRLKDIIEEGKKQLKEKLSKQILNKPAQNFSLKSLDGKTFNLADLKGKVVVLDFWATWCNPCKISFPALQKVYDKYLNNESIVILAVNTWEREKGSEREKIVADFIKENKYTFNVLLDGDDWGILSKYEVQNIPTKLVIDKEGIIQFKTIGFYGEREMMDEMDAQFDMLLKDEHKTYIKQ